MRSGRQQAMGPREADEGGLYRARSRSCARFYVPFAVGVLAHTADGSSPFSNFVRDAVRNLYGTTSEGGLGSGAIFKLTPTGGGRWTQSVDRPFEGRQMVAFPATAWSSIDSETSTVLQLTAAKPTTVATSSRLEGAATGNSFGAVESRKISICNRV